MSVEQAASVPVQTREDSTTWKISATSVCGSSHEKLDLPCQDAHCYAVRADHVLLAAVADGAGSAKHSDIGAAIAAEKSVEVLRTDSDLANRLIETPDAFKPILKGALEASLRAVQIKADALDIAPRELASTLIVVIATPHLIATAQIGDGAAVASDKDNNLIALTTPDSGEYINQTTFLISPKAIDTAQFHLWHGEATHIALFSDGLQMLALTLPFGKPHSPFFSPLFKFISSQKPSDNTNEKLATFLKSSRVRQRTDDDVTLLLAARTD